MLGLGNQTGAKGSRRDQNEENERKKMMPTDIFRKRLSGTALSSAAITVGSTLSSNGYRTFPQQSLTPSFLPAE